MSETFDGGCACRTVRFRMKSRPLIVHCCHCTWCQRETGSAFAVNALIESDRVDRLSGEPERVGTPSQSGKGQVILRCPNCRIAVWSHYPQSGQAVSFVRVGTLDEPGKIPPDIHIYTSTRLPWVVLPEGARAVPEFYKTRDVWPAESMARVSAMMASVKR
ncbi:MAG: GFA family protein [Rhizobiaceae bacterium]